MAELGRSRARCRPLGRRHSTAVRRGGDEERYPGSPALPRGGPTPQRAAQPCRCRGQAGRPQVLPPGAAPAPLTSVPGGKAPGSSLALRPLRADGRRLPAVPQAGDTRGGGGGRRGERGGPNGPAPASSVPVPTPGSRERRGGCEAAAPGPKAAGGPGAEFWCGAELRGTPREQQDGGQGLPTAPGAAAAARPAVAGPRRS